MEENNRNHGDPWSLRQTGIYQQANAEKRKSTWIFLQLSRFTRCLLEIATQSQTEDSSDGFMKLHCVLLSATVDNWGKYIEYLHSQLRDMDEKACFSKMEISSSQNYLIKSSDMQVLQRLRYKVLETASVLESCFNLAMRLKAHCFSLNEFSPCTSNHESITSIEGYAADIKVYQQSIAKIIPLLKGTFDLISKILEMRNIESLQIINRDSGNNIVLLRESVALSHKENRAASIIAIQNHKDAKMIKALAMVSTIFLPASLIATIFSSNLVQIQQDSDQFVLAKQFWIYVLVSVGLTLAAFGWTRFLEYRWLKDILSLEKYPDLTA